MFVEGAVSKITADPVLAKTTASSAAATLYTDPNAAAAKADAVPSAAPTAAAAATTSVATDAPALTTAQPSTRLEVIFNYGENYASLIRRNRKWFSSVSDTLNAYIIRGNEHIPLNLNPMLYDASFRSDVLVQENDTLIVPFRQYFVSVTGAVIAPGRYPYIPDRNWEYYISLAGGFVPGQNSFQAVKIVDLSGKKMKKTDMITPETVITASNNNFLFFFNQYAPVIGTTLTILVTGLSVYTAYQSYMNR
jgi:hypothetical protein